MLRISLVGAVIAALYGIIHDQITYSISPEYFTRVKFAQFHYADFGLPPRLLVAEIGVLATWWVGFIAGWFLARVTVPSRPPAKALRSSLHGFGIIFASALLAGVVGYCVGLFPGANSEFATWRDFAAGRGVVDLPNFVRVAYLHNAGYLGALLGLIAALIDVRRASRT
jgi:hypothetical protein